MSDAFPHLVNIHGLGHVPDRHDDRDRPLSLVLADADLPTKIEQIDSAFPIYDQNGDAACVGFSYKEAAQIVLLNLYGLRTSISPSFLWWLGRDALGTTGQNDGCMIRDVIKAANVVGVAANGACPYVPGNYAARPSDEAFAQAKNHPAFDYEVTQTSRDVKVALAHKTPVVFGTILTESFDKAGSNGGFFPVPAGQVIGGHAMTLVGYNDDIVFAGWPKGGFRYRNHWTAGWGDQGWGWVPYAHFDSAAVSDAWCLRGIRR